MKKIGVYPGTFDPLTNGHVDIIERSSKIFDYLIIAVVESNSKKDLLFSAKDRKKLIEKSLVHLLNIEVEIFQYCRNLWSLKLAAKPFSCATRNIREGYHYTKGKIQKK